MASANDGAAQIRKLMQQPWLLLLGAGTSVPCGVKPWRGLAEAAIQFGTEHRVPEETLAYARSSMDRGRLSLVFDAIEQELPGGAWTGWLKREMTPSRGFTETHTALLKMGPSGVVTTNYDTLADGAYGQVLAAGPQSSRTIRRRFFRFKPRPNSCAISTAWWKDEGRRFWVLSLTGSSTVERQHHATASDSSSCAINVLYVGFGHTDLDFEYLCQGALEQLNSSYYAISLQPSDGVPSAFAERLRRLNINVVTYDKVDALHSGLTALVREIAP